MVTSNFNGDQGFVQKPYAKKKLVKNPDGTVRVVYTDVRTGRPVDPKGYTVIESANSLETQPTEGLSQKDPKIKPPEQSQTNMALGLQNRGENPNIAAAQATGDKALTKTGQDYISKPSWASFLGFLPGPLGLAATAGNVGINANNVAAVNDQRAMLGFTPNSILKNTAGVMMDNNGLVGQAAVTNGQGKTSVAPVSFEAQDSVGRTAYTPNEARMREQVSQNLTEANQAQTDAAIKTFKDENPPTGFISGLASTSKGLFENIFGTTPAQSGGLAVSVGNVAGFPEKPNAPVNSSGSPDDRDNTNDSGYSSPGLF